MMLMTVRRKPPNLEKVEIGCDAPLAGKNVPVFQIAYHGCARPHRMQIN
jgi:hypothetical protein